MPVLPLSHAVPTDRPADYRTSTLSGDPLPTPDPSTARPLLLDIGAYIAQAQGESPDHGAFSLLYYPTCGEAVAAWQPLRTSSDRRPLRSGVGATPADHAERSGRRARTVVRRIALHNDLGQMLTFTYREGVPRDLDKVPEHFRLFWQRFSRLTGARPGHYVIVPEWGSKTQRLHFHMGVSWWDFDAHTNACYSCASPKLRREAASWLPKAGERVCVGCLWGLGHVYPPKAMQGRDGAQELASYCSKYMGKAFGETSSVDVRRVGFGQHRYRASKGAKPVPERYEVSDLWEGLGALQALGHQVDSAWALHTELEDYQGAPAVLFRFDRVPQ